MNDLKNFIAMLFMLWCTLCFGQTPERMMQDFAQTLTDKSSLSSVIIQQDSCIYFGLEKVNDNVQIIDCADNIYAIGSISKVFTAAIYAALLEQKKIKANDPIRKHLKIKYKTKDRITMDQLANHTSGLPRLPDNIFEDLLNFPDNPYKNFSEERMIEYLEQYMHLDHKPGSHFDYSNLGMGLLGFICSKITGNTYEELLKEYVFEPLEMHQSSSQVETLQQELFVRSYDEMGNPIKNWNMNILSPAGAIYASPKDMAKFAKSILKNKISYLNDQCLPTYKVDEDLSIGRAWFILQKNNQEYLFHNGQVAGHSSCMLIDKNNQKAVILLSNLDMTNSKSNEIDALCFKMIELLDSKISNGN